MPKKESATFSCGLRKLFQLTAARDRCQPKVSPGVRSLARSLLLQKDSWSEEFSFTSKLFSSSMIFTAGCSQLITQFVDHGKMELHCVFEPEVLSAIDFLRLPVSTDRTGALSRTIRTSTGTAYSGMKKRKITKLTVQETREIVSFSPVYLPARIRYTEFFTKLSLWKSNQLGQRTSSFVRAMLLRVVICSSAVGRKSKATNGNIQDTLAE